MKELSIIVVNWNTRDLLRQCLSSIYDTIDSLDFEVIVVDNASQDDSVAMVKKDFPQVRLIENDENVGFARANNQAIACATGRYILLLNTDTIVHMNSLQQLVEFMDNHSEVGAAGPRTLNPDGTLQISWGRFPHPFLSAVLGFRRDMGHPSRMPQKIAAGEAVSPFSVDWVRGACMIVRSETIGKVGLMDQTFFIYSEEMDWCSRMKTAGWQICCLPSAQITHYGAQSAKPNVEMFVRLHESKYLFYRKHYGAGWAGFLIAGFILKNLLWMPVLLCQYVMRFSQRRWILQRIQQRLSLLRALVNPSFYRVTLVKS